MAGDAPKRVPLASVLVVLAAFLAGAATGAGAYASFGPRRHHPPPMRDGKHRLPPFIEGLGLTPEQRTAVEAVVQKYSPRFEAVFRENAPKLQALREEMDAEVLPLLTEEQRVKFEELKKRRPEGGPGPGFGPPPGGAPPPPPN